MKIYNVIAFPPGSFKIIVFVLCIFGVIVPLFIQVIILLYPSSVKDDSLFLSQNLLYEQLEIKKEKIESLEKHLKELDDIRIKALHGLVNLEAKRVMIQNEIFEAKKVTNDMREEENQLQGKIEKTKKELEFSQQAKVQKVITNIVHVGIPQKRTVNFKRDDISDFPRREVCNLRLCFDYSKCSVLKKFTFHLYWTPSERLHPSYTSFTEFDEYSSDWLSSCVILVMVDLTQSIKEIRNYLSKVPTWKSSDYNHMLLLMSDDEEHYCEKIKQLQLNRPILIVNRCCPCFRNRYDFLFPNFDMLIEHNPVPLYPIGRKYLLFFASEFLKTNASDLSDEGYMFDLGETEDVYVTRNCNGLFGGKCTSGSWCACNRNSGWRKEFVQNSLFTLIIIDSTNPLFLTEIIDTFRCGSIPVFIGVPEYLPFSDVIDWKRATVIFPSQRLPELVFSLRSIPFNDLVALKLQGNFIYNAYFSSQRTLMLTILTYLRNKIGLTPRAINDFNAVLLNRGMAAEQRDPHKITYVSPQFVSNFSFIGKNQYVSWNRYPGGLRLYPVVPWNDPAPSTIQFLDEGKDYYMPIGDGAGGDGVAFSRSLGGDYPVEEFTIVMLTYDREAILMEALQRLSGMKYLNKVVVVWNHPVDPVSDLEWPDIGVELEVIRAGKNSLNNRFIPYNAVKTEAILSMDDDIYLRHDEIELAFRIWRENRDRLVGFPGRHHSYNATSKSFYYNSEHSCELSLVLTGGAFFHKYYSYVYTHDMSQLIRDMVDEYMNCEDIAMNFLVAHITKKPPIKVTSRWTFRCPECPVALSADAHHYEERHTCIAYFEKLYGFNPLKRTQFRADSILFKTRIPATMKKCFQFV